MDDTSAIKMIPDDRRPGVPGAAAWLLLAALGLHMVEEWSQFPSWATHHFGTTSTNFYLVSHIPIVILVAWIVATVARKEPTRRALLLFVVALSAFATNAVFHLATAVLFNAYSPGVISGVVLFIPLFAYFVPRLRRRLEGRSFTFGLLIGACISLLFAASLQIDMPAL